MLETVAGEASVQFPWMSLVGVFKRVCGTFRK